MQENTLSENNSTVHELPISDESVQTDWLKKFIVVLGKIKKYSTFTLLWTQILNKGDLNICPFNQLSLEAD